MKRPACTRLRTDTLRRGFTRLRSPKLRRGFTIIELMLVIGIIGIMGAISIPLYSDYQIRSDLNLATEQASQGLARARILSQAGKGDVEWGFYVPNGTLYKGKTYLTRDPAYDEVYPMPSTITTTGLLQVSFSKIEGVPSATGSITLTALNGDQRSVLMTIERSGIAMNQTDRITICHDPSGQKNTLSLPDNAWPAHQAHGDTLGACPADASSSSSSSLSSAASAISSAPSSVAAVCANRIAVASDGTITTTSTVNITWKALGSAITYGAGGPEVDVYVSYRDRTTGAYTDLFNGYDIDGNETQTVNGIAAGKIITTKIRGYYKQRGWLTFDQSFTNSDTTGHVLTLRNGDTLPNYPAFANQASLQSFLQPYVNASRIVTISQYDVLYLVELGTIGTPMPSSADFQDAVLLVTFGQPAGAC